MWLVIPSLVNRRFGQSSLLRFDPKVSTDYKCIFVEGHSRPSFAIPWTIRSTPTDYFRIRYTPLAKDQPYGIMFVDPRTLAYEGHAGFAERPTHLSGRLDSPAIVRDWMRSQFQSAQAASHDGDAQEIYAAIVALAQRDLEHFTLADGVTLSHFQIGYASLTDHRRPSWPITLMPLIPIWFGVYGRGGRKQLPNPQGGANGRQPLRSDSNGEPAVAASRRSP